MPLAHMPNSAGLVEAVVAFGTEWLYVLVPALAALGIGALLWRRGRVLGGRGVVDAFGWGAEAVSGLPPWCSGPLLILGAALLIAVMGFFWDVGWHIALGRDEFLFSPPHTCLALGISLIGVAGLVSTRLATAHGADVGWRVRALRVPRGAAVLLAASGTAFAGFWVDELWHWAYGLDVTMWSPPHLTMISAAAFTPMAAWLLVGEAGGSRRRGVVPRLVRGLPVSATLIGLSAWLLEFDMGVPQWQQGFHPLLVVLAAGLALTAARAALGPWGALRALAGFLVVRGLLTLLTAHAWGLVEARFAPYIVSAVVVEFAFLALRGRPPLWQGLGAGLAVSTLGLAGEWAAVRAWSWVPWTSGLLVRWAPALLAVGLAAGVLGVAFGRLMRRLPAGVGAPQVALALGVVLVALAVALPRQSPPGEVTVRTTPAGAESVAVEVAVRPADAVVHAERFGVLAWQGGGMVWAPLEPIAPGRFAATRPVPVGHHWKTMVRFARGGLLGAVAVAMPADPEIGAAEVPLQRERTTAFQPEQELLLREAHDGPVWPGVVGYGFTALALGAVVGLLVAGAASLSPRVPVSARAAVTRAAVGKGARR